MKESRFIELLNLYVDQQLSPQEATELEAEIERNPARRRTYLQYCRMQKACSQLFEYERSAAPASTVLTRALATADRKMAPAETVRRPVWNWGYSFAAVAAAACVAVVVVLQTRPGAPGNQPSGTVLATTTEQAPAAPVQAVVTTPAPEIEEFVPVFSKQPADSSIRPGLFLTGIQLEDTPGLEWTRELTFAPVRPVDKAQLTFETNKKPEQTPLLEFRPAQDTEEPIAAFQFQK